MGSSSSGPVTSGRDGVCSSISNSEYEYRFWKKLLTYEKDHLIPPLGDETVQYSLGISVSKKWGHTGIVIIPRGHDANGKTYSHAYTLELQYSSRTRAVFLREPRRVRKRRSNGDPDAEWICSTSTRRVIVRKVRAIVLVELAWDIINTFGKYSMFLNNCRHFVSEWKQRWRDVDFEFKSELWQHCKSIHDNTLNPFFWLKMPLLAVAESELGIVSKFGLGFFATIPAFVGMVGEVITDVPIGLSIHASQRAKGRRRIAQKNDKAVVPRFYQGEFYTGQDTIKTAMCYYCDQISKTLKIEGIDVFEAAVHVSDDANAYKCAGGDACDPEKRGDMLRYCSNEHCKASFVFYCDKCSGYDQEGPVVKKAEGVPRGSVVSGCGSEIDSEWSDYD